jgi:predicted lipoprotein with Yx(FWY)xxD motif
MRHPRITAAAIAVGVAAAVGGVTVASASGSSYGSASPRYPAARGASSSGGALASNAATVQIATATVRGTPESILEDAKGLPLYTYQPDTATASRVSGQLAALWPPLIAAHPTAAGAGGTLTSLATSNGRQVSYNGHFLYTFVEDAPGRVTGQGIQNFFVATPGGPARGAPVSRSSATTPPPAGGNGYGY